MDEGKAGGRSVDDVIDGAGQEALYGRCAAVERNVLHVEAGLAVEEIAGQPRGDNPRAIVELAGIRLGARNQLLHGLRSILGAHTQKRRVLGCERDRRKILERVIREIAACKRIEHQRDIHCRQQGVAVGRRFGDAGGANRGIGAGLISDHHRLSPDLAQPLRDHAREDVGRSAGRERHDDFDWARGKHRGLLLRGRGSHYQRRRNCERDCTTDHETMLLARRFSLAILTTALLQGNRGMRASHSKFPAHALASFALGLAKETTVLAPASSRQDRMAMYNLKKLKIGLFGANCSSGRAVTLVPERWSGSWPDNLKLAQLADDGGIDFLLPIGRWKGYGGDTDYQGATLETITWATSLLASTKHVTVFGTVHAPL